MTENGLIRYERLKDSDFEDIIELIVTGVHYKDIADKYSVPMTTFFRFISKPEYSARLKEAKEFAAHLLVDEAERVLAQAKDDPRLLWVAKELAHHYRWKASMIYGRQYATKKILLEDEPTEKKITVKVIRGNGNNS